MGLKIKVEFDFSKLEKSLIERFSVGSKAQELWSNIVFYGSAPYMPHVSGTFIKLSEAASIRLFKSGYLLYPTQYAHYLWEGILMVDPETGSAWAQKGATKIYTSEELNFNRETNPKATKQWVIAARNENLELWLKEFEAAIKRGAV
jgi:hypothetical protein